LNHFRRWLRQKVTTNGARNRAETAFDHWRSK
jgi:hypothetical protein